MHWTGKISFMIVFFYFFIIIIYTFFLQFFSESTWMHYIFTTPPPTLPRYRIPTALELLLYNKYAHHRHSPVSASRSVRYLYLLYCLTQRVMVQYYYCINISDITIIILLWYDGLCGIHSKSSMRLYNNNI